MDAFSECCLPLDVVYTELVKGLDVMKFWTSYSEPRQAKQCLA